MTARRASRGRRLREVARPPSLVLLDANVIFDMLLFRAPWYEDAIAIFEAVEDGRLRAVLASHTVTTIWCVLRRQSSDALSRSALRRLLSSLPVAQLDENDMLRALALGVADFEDACQIVAAEQAGAEAIVTRDTRHFKGSPLPVLTPAHLVARLGT